MKLFCILLFATFFRVTSFAQETPEKHPIDLMLDNCLSNEENFTTRDMLECTQKAYEAWDKELNIVYKKLMSKLSENGKSVLKRAQIEWIAFRDLEFKTIDSIYDILQGTMYIPMRLNDKMDLVRRRTLQLNGYLQLLTL
ncbi:MAG: hypothetical protein CVV24_06025 [Ignavibacteriae bacterium HGW-Ignavibacteriae-3]|nr:MAG: hypothetical protein CVV24_06025 [Ignavibacteriae bacterium HGW-Ignavibacteriae-3]